MTQIQALPLSLPIATPEPRPRPLPPQPVSRAKASPSERLDELSAHRAAIFRYLRPKCRDVHQAEDLTQDALLRAARSKRGLHGIASPRAWLLQIAANLYRDSCRRRAYETLVPDDSQVLSLAEGHGPIPGDERRGTLVYIGGRAYPSTDVELQVDQLWTSLGIRDRAVLRLFYIEGRSVRETAQRLGIPAPSVKVWLFRARRRLKSALTARLARQEIRSMGSHSAELAC